MKIILSPSKLQTEKTIFERQRPPLAPQKTAYLLEQLKRMPYQSLKSFYNVKDKIGKQVYDQLHAEELKQCDTFGMYSGVVFKEINAASYDARQREYLLEHGVVLSALYGILEADMAVHGYRLDMTKKIDDINLYDYWQDEVDRYFDGVDLVVNLASKEFSRMLKHYRGHMLNVHFTEEQSNGKYKVVTVRAKQARGLMFDYLVTNCVTALDDVKHFAEAGYQYSAAHSDDDNYYFIKPYGQ